NRPADGVERPVGDHLAIVLKSDAPACDADQEARLIATMRAKDAATTVITTSTTTTKTTTTTTTQKPQTSSANPTPPPR
ncbi:MAG TPA: hypothetical protein VJ853_14990, partial [Thermoanaerobaculia bacterium]|nr:hypothetical protein [Thermoanaerobaculia bacterium]